mgnify:CR=1 FL=1
MMVTTSARRSEMTCAALKRWLRGTGADNAD